jgi:hypothetical protein
MNSGFKFLIFTLLAAFSQSCKKKDNAEPVITISHPVSGTAFNPGDTIHVEADLSDDGDLTSVTIKLLNAAYTPVDHQQSFSVNASSYHLTYDYIIENNYLETGNYFLTVSSSDGDHDVNAYRTITIHEIPRTTEAVYVITAPDTTKIKVNKVDAANQLVLQFEVTGDYSGSAINARYKRLATSGRITGDYHLFDLSNNSPLFSFPVYNSMLPSFQCVTAAHELSFVSLYDGRIKGFDKDGNVKFNSPQPVYYIPGSLCVNDQYVFTEAYYQNANENRLAVLFYPSGVAKQEYNIEIDIVSMVSLDDNNIIVFGNNNGDGKIYFYHVTSNGINDFHTLFSNTIFSAIAIDGDRYAIATANGLYSYEASSNNLVPMDLSESVYSLEYDDVNGILFANAGRKIKEYAFPNPGVLSNIFSIDSILDTRVLFSK